jgi:4-hydroxy-tetrahydrodipicolinate reductase
MIRVIVTGALGRMGSITTDKVVNSQEFSLVADVDPRGEKFPSLEAVSGQADVIIDFSFHTATPGILEWAKTNKVGVVMCTTGHTPEELEAIREASKEIPVFHSANMSLGVALLAELAKKTAAAFPDADIEIVETHHNRKADAPSGTALLLAHRMQEVLTDSVLLVGRHENGKRTAKEIGIHSLRLGNEVGTHEIIIATGAETITLKHEAENRSLFANGALAAAAFLGGKPAGMYSMQDII